MTRSIVLKNSGRFKLCGLDALLPALEDIEGEVLDLSSMAELSLRSDPAVIEVAPSMPIKLIRPIKPATPTVRNIPNVGWGIQAIGAEDAVNDGAGVTVAVLDTGIDRTHPAFQGLEILSRNFTDEPDEDMDGHGTHCAGIIFGRTTNNCRIGVAPGIKRALIGKVIGKHGGTTASLFEAILWAYREKTHVINMSVSIDFGAYLHTQASIYPHDLALSKSLTAYQANVKLFDQLSKIISETHGIGHGVVVVAAAGNESRRDVNPDYRAVTAPPASSNGFISVGALGKNPQGSERPFSISNFTNAGATVIAPGEEIVSAKAGGGLDVYSGTSMATPHVAGVAALLASKWLAEGKRLSATELRSQILGSVRRLPEMDQEDTGLGLVHMPASDGDRSRAGILTQTRIPVELRKRRAFVHVSDVTEDQGRRTVSVSVPRWKEGISITLDEEVFPSEYRPSLKKGSVFIASINTEASEARDLTMEEFELVPPEDLADEAS